ncbi:hypothetical protein CWE17_01970 [Synechococcus sp. BS56D]|nr:hypothetical protein CWE17_01970 [Synechococcus sp. BS56D]
MAFDTQMIIALLQELLLAHRANATDDFRAWLSLGIERLGEPAVIELMLDGLNPILTTDEAERLVGWHLGSASNPDEEDKRLLAPECLSC